MPPADSSNDRSRWGKAMRLRRVLGWLGVLIAAPFFIWLPISLLDLVPSMIEVFGIAGLRIPAAATIAGLLLAAIGFHEI